VSLGAGRGRAALPLAPERGAIPVTAGVNAAVDQNDLPNPGRRHGNDGQWGYQQAHAVGSRQPADDPERPDTDEHGASRVTQVYDRHCESSAISVACMALDGSLGGDRFRAGTSFC